MTLKVPLSFSLAFVFLAGALVHAVDFKDYDSEEIDEYPDETFQVTIDPRHRTLLSAELRSPVVKINKRLGEGFKKGETLIQLDDTVYQSNLKKAQAVLDRAQVELVGKKELYDDNVVSLFELKEAEANVAIAEADIAIAKRDLDATVINAPYDGKVVTVSIEEYELPQAGEDLIEIVDDKTLLAKLLVPASLLDTIKIGSPLTIQLHQVNDAITAKILRIGSVIDPSSATVKIEAKIDNSDGKLWAGMTGTAKFDGIQLTPSPQPPLNEPFVEEIQNNIEALPTNEEIPKAEDLFNPPGDVENSSWMDYLPFGSQEQQQANDSGSE